MMNRYQVEIDRIKITCSETSGFAYPQLCFYWIADSRNHCNISTRACLSDWIKYTGYGPKMTQAAMSVDNAINKP
ncbi:hypothetical protein Y032_0024g1065 [Ancylostoma ceylanicum]|uniref:Uncharacterized protein n=1 Tax=Ancylostoma ceylanicum TaxID=53326 RepID=A0A016UY41_9BILA|nr:hypothetical protein Y032_0024g1065 [Ancylostoma ceylanicum]